MNLDFARGLASERTRLREITLASEAVGKERAAIELALNTQLSPEAARRALRELAAPSPGGVVVNIASIATETGGISKHENVEDRRRQE